MKKLLVFLVPMFLLVIGMVLAANTPTCTFYGATPTSGSTQDNSSLYIEAYANLNSTNTTGSYVTITWSSGFTNTSNATAVTSGAEFFTNSNISVGFFNLDDGTYTIDAHLNLDNYSDIAWTGYNVSTNLTTFGADCTSRTVIIDTSEGSALPAAIQIAEGEEKDTQQNLITLILIIIVGAVIYNNVKKK